jgi:hypothetical protein
MKENGFNGHDGRRGIDWRRRRQDDGGSGSARTDLLRQADDMRSKLARTVERIDQRRHDVLDVKKQVTRHLKEIALLVGLVIVGVAGASAFFVHKLLTSAQRRRRGGWLGPALRRLGDRGEVRGGWEAQPASSGGRRRSFVGEVARSLALTLVTSVLARPLKRAAAR